MEYTHTFEFSYGDRALEGELIFNHEQEPALKLNLGADMEVAEYQLLLDIVSRLCKLTCKHGEINKLEIALK